MPKAGLIHDYDLMANAEDASVGVTCAVCDTPNTRFQWSDYAGEAMCCQCGCPYQLKWGSTENEAEGKYPYLNMDDKWLPVAREFWAERKRFVHYGASMSRNDGMPELTVWLKSHHPEMLKRDATNENAT